VQDGSLFLRINRGGSSDWVPPAPVTPVVTQTFNDDSNSFTTTSQDTFVETNIDSDWVPPAPVTPVVTQTVNDDSNSFTTTSQDTLVETNIY